MYNVFGTDMHIVTFIITIVEIIGLLAQILYYLSRPDETIYNIIVFILLIVYNITGGLFPDPKMPLPVSIQTIIAYGTGFLCGAYFPYYVYKAYQLEKMKFHALYGFWIFLILPFLIFFVIVYLFTKDINFVKLSLIIPLVYCGVALYALTKSVLYKYNFEKTSSVNERNEELIVMYISMVPWIALPLIMLTNQPQWLEVSLTNSGFLILVGLHIKRSIDKSKDEYERLIKSEAGLKDLTLNLQKKVEERTKEIEIVSQQKTNTFINLAHETKTPLTLIINHIQEFKIKNGTTKEFEIIEKNIEKLKNNIGNFFDLEKLTLGYDLYNHETITNFSTLLTDNIELFSISTKRKNISLEYFIDGIYFIQADLDALDRIILNLIENAIKFTSTNILISLTQQRSEVIFSVKDDGPGIEPDLHNKIYEPYYQIGTDKTFQGLGLGLAIVKKIIAGLNGRLVIISDPSKMRGTDIQVILPLFKVADSLTPSKKPIMQSMLNMEVLEPSETKKIDSKRRTILIVEDDIGLLNFITKKFFDLNKYNVIAAINGLEALDKIENTIIPDIMITDLMMPKMDGYELASKIQLDYSQVPIIFLTAKSSEGEKLKGLMAGAIDFIPKPFQISELILKVDSLLLMQQGVKRKLSDALINLALNQQVQNKNSSINRDNDKFGLTKKETEILEMIMAGKNNKEISEAIFIAESTVAKHIQNIYGKVGAKNRVDLINKVK